MNRSNQHSLDASLSLSMAATGDTDMCTREESSQSSATEQKQPKHQQRCRRPYRHQQSQHHPSTQFLGCTTQDNHRAGSQLTEMLTSVPRSCSMRALFDTPSNLEPKACTRCDEGNDDGSDGNDSTALGFDDEGKQESLLQPSSFSVETARINDIASSLSTSELNLEPPASAGRCVMGVMHFDTNITSSSPFPSPYPTNSHNFTDLTQSTDPSEPQLDNPHITYPGNIRQQNQTDSTSTTPSALPFVTSTAPTPKTKIISSVDIKYTRNTDLIPASNKTCPASKMNQQDSRYRPHSCNNSRVHKDLDQDSDSDYNSSSSNSSSNRSSRSSSISGDAEQEGSERMKGCQDLNPDSRLPSPASMTGKPVSMKRRKVSEDEGHDVDSVPDYVSALKGSRLAPGQSLLQSSFSTKASSPHSNSPCRKRRSVQSEPPSKSPVGSKALGSACLDTSSLSLLSATSAMVSEGSISTAESDATCGQPIVPFQPTPSPSPMSLLSIEELSTFRPLDPLEERTCVTAETAGRPMSYQQYRRSAPLLVGPCRKRSFEDAIELTRPLGNDPSVEHIGWFGSIKRRKIHHYPTRWTSSLSPTPYVKLMAIRDFWDVMMSRLDLSWLNLWTVRASTWHGYSQEGCLEAMEITEADDGGSEIKDVASLPGDAERADTGQQDVGRAGVITHGFSWAVCLRAQRRTVVQYPSTGISLRGLWEEEETIRRRRQMIPEGVHKPPRSKILNRKPIPRFSSHHAQTLARAALSSRSSSSPSLSHSKDENQSPQEACQLPRSQALSEGHDLNEYRPWRDGTVTPHQGSFRSLRQLRRTMLGPWPAEESRARDECTRILHRMREQLNVVINLQIHLRSMIKTVPAHMSFLLSIRHPGQVSIELLNALYGPQFMQSSAFRAIEQLLWGRKQPQRIEQHLQPQHQHVQHTSHSFSHQYLESQCHGHYHHGLADSTESCNPERSYHHYQQGQNDLMEDDECAFEEAFDEPAYQDPMLGLDHTVGDDRETFGSNHTADDRKLHGNSSLHKAFYTPQDGEDEDVEELAVLRPRMDVVSAGQHFV